MDDPDFGFDDLNPNMAIAAGNAFFGCLLWLLILGGLAALLWKLFA